MKVTYFFTVVSVTPTTLVSSPTSLSPARSANERKAKARPSGGDDMGCEECGAPGSSIRLELQKNRAQDLRLRVYATCFCWCKTVYGEPYAEDAEHFYVPMQNAVAKKAKS